MTEKLLLKDVSAMNSLAERIAASPVLSRFPNPTAESESLAYSLSDLEGSMRVFLDEQLPKLADPNVKGEELEDLLLDVREEFRHILYHMHDPEFFRLVEPTHDWLVLAETAKK
jgi:hypothetical protein